MNAWTSLPWWSWTPLGVLVAVGSTWKLCKLWPALLSKLRRVEKREEPPQGLFQRLTSEICFQAYTDQAELIAWALNVYLRTALGYGEDQVRAELTRCPDAKILSLQLRTCEPDLQSLELDGDDPGCLFKLVFDAPRRRICLIRGALDEDPERFYRSFGGAELNELIENKLLRGLIDPRPARYVENGAIIEIL